MKKLYTMVILSILTSMTISACGGNASGAISNGGIPPVVIAPSPPVVEPPQPINPIPIDPVPIDPIAIIPDISQANLVAQSLGNSSVLVDWEPVEDTDNYQVFQNDVMVADNIIGTEWTASGLDPVSAYSYTLRACNLAACSELSAPFATSTTGFIATGSIHEVAGTTAGETNLLEGAAALAQARVGANQYLFVASGFGSNPDNAINSFQVGTNGELGYIGAIADGERDADLLAGVSALATAQLGPNTYLLATSRDDNALSVFNISSDGNLDHLDDTPLGSPPLLGGNSVTTVDLGDNTYVITSQELLLGSSISVFSLANDGTLTLRDTATILDTSVRPLFSPAGLSTALIEGVTYLLLTDRDTRVLASYSIAADGSLSYVDDIDGSSNFANLPGLEGPRDSLVAYLGANPYVFTAAKATSSGGNPGAVSSFSINGTGHLEAVDSITDGQRSANLLRGANSLASAVIGETNYLFVGAQSDDAVSIFRIEDNGNLVFVDSIAHLEAGAANLEEPQELLTLVIGTDTYLAVTASRSSAISLFRVGR